MLSVKTAMKLLGVESPGQLIDTFAQRQLLDRQMEDAASQLAALESDPSVAEAQREVQEVQLEQQNVEARLSELSGTAGRRTPWRRRWTRWRPPSARR